MDYAKHYNELMSRARARALECYTERHHVLPRALGGGDDPANLVRLTPEEHYVAHLLLVKMHPGHVGLMLALRAMRMNGRLKAQSENKEFGWLRRRMAEALSQMRTGRKHSPEARAKMGVNRGRKQRDDEKAARSAALKGRSKAPEHVAKVSAALKGKPGTRLGMTNSPEHRARQAVAATGRKHTPETIWKMVNHKTPEQRRALALKAWETKRRKALERL
jgi:hypothetical protein